MSTALDDLFKIEPERFGPLLKTLTITEECLDCNHFNPKAEGGYRCAVSCDCIGVTLATSLKSYLLWKLDILTEDEHREVCGI